MAGAVAGSGRAKTIAAINITPLVDVVLVLLVILMVASTYIVAQTLKVHLPKAKMSDGTAEKPNTVQLTKNGDLRWNEQPVVEKDLEGLIRNAVASENPTRSETWSILRLVFARYLIESSERISLMIFLYDVFLSRSLRFRERVPMANFFAISPAFGKRPGDVRMMFLI